MPAETAFALALLALGCAPIVVLVLRSGERCVLDVRGGTVRVRRGKPPVRLLADVRDVVQRAAVKRARLRIVAEGGRPRLIIDGDMDAGTAQQLRNVVGTFKLAEFPRG